MLVDFHRMLLTHDVALSVYHFFHPRKNPYKYVHSVKIELAKLILVGTRITYLPSHRGRRTCIWICVLLRVIVLVSYSVIVVFHIAGGPGGLVAVL